MTRLKVAVADDHVLFCSGIEMIIRSQPDLAFVGAAHDGDTIVELAAATGPDVVLMDIRMPHTDGIAATREVLRVAPSTRVIVLTTHERREAVTAAVEVGAHGFVMKDARPDFLLAAIRSVHEGNSVYAPSTTAALIRDIAPPSSPDLVALAPLTPREREVYLLAARGLTNAEIAEAAFISETTVKTHMSNTLNKLGLTSRIQLIAHAYSHRLVN